MTKHSILKGALCLLVTMMCNVSWADNVPFKTSEAPDGMGWDANTTWYFIDFPHKDNYHTGGYLAAEGAGFISADGFQSDVSKGRLLITQTEKPVKYSALWCIVGDATSGYQFYNRMNPLLKLGSDSNGDARLYLASQTKSGVTYAYEYASSTHASYTDCATFRLKGTNKYLNDFDGDKDHDYLNAWDSDAARSAGGSAIRLTEVTDEELAQMEAVLPKVSGEEGERVYYTIKNQRSADFATYAGDNAQIMHQARNVESQAQMWYFTADGNGYRLHNMATGKKFAGTSSFTADGVKVYIKENPYCAGYLCISTHEDLSSDCWDSQGSNKIGTWNPRTTDYEGTSWVIAEAALPDSLPMKLVVDGWTEKNPNTHFGNLTVTGKDVIASKLTLVHMQGASMKYSAVGDVVSFSRPYRGFDFLGFFLGDENLGKTFAITEEMKNSISEENPLVVKFNATDDVTLWYDDDPFSYRIPAIGKTSTGRLIAVSDYRYSLDDIGRYNYGTATPGIDLVIRTSDDNGKTWSETKTIAKCSGKRGANDCAYGDAAIAVVGEKVLVMGAAGDVMFANGSATAHNRTVRIFSEDNGETWTKPQDISDKLFIGSNAVIKNGYTAFFGSGKLAVDEDYNGTGNARIYGAMLIKKEGYGNAIYVIYTDDFGVNWSILGGSQNPVTTNDEPKVEILPSGQILLSVRRSGGRQFNVFTYSDKTRNTGSWSSNENGCGNGGSNTCNGEIYLVNAKKTDGSAVKLLLQSQPKGGSGLYDRRDVTIWYKVVSNTKYSTSQIVTNWTQGMQVSTQQSSYSTMVMQDDGKIAFFFEEAPCFGDDQAKGYCMVYTPLTIEQITNNKYFSPDVKEDETSISEVKTENGNVKTEIYDLVGRRVQNAQKGVFIVNGKVVVK